MLTIKYKHDYKLLPHSLSRSIDNRSRVHSSVFSVERKSNFIEFRHNTSIGIYRKCVKHERRTSAQHGVWRVCKSGAVFDYVPIVYFNFCDIEFVACRKKVFSSLVLFLFCTVWRTPKTPPGKINMKGDKIKLFKTQKRPCFYLTDLIK